jgi:hypothetical protein
MAELADYAWLIGGEGAAWIERMAPDGRSELQQLAALRRELSAERARLVVEQVELRCRAADKFGDRAAAMFFTRVHLEQATDLWIARYKAGRLPPDGQPVADYCCGIGGDLIGMAEHGTASGWDLSPVACLLADANLQGRAAVHCGDVAQIKPSRGGWWHLDPDRRATGRRVTDFTEYAPAADLAMEWIHANPSGIVKLAPATTVPDGWAADAELEWITRDRECRQQVAWLAPLAECAGLRRATRVQRENAHVTFTGVGGAPCDVVDAPASYLFDPDPSLLAARLLGAFAAAHNLSSLGVGNAYLTGDSALADGLADCFVVHDCLPLRAPTLAKYLAERSVGRLEIKKRGVAVEPETLRRQLKLRGDNSATIVLTRIGRREVAIVAERLSS